MSQAAATPLVGVVMGSKSDWKVMEAAVRILREFDIPYEARVVSAHRTPDLLFEYAEMAQGRGLRAIVAGAGGAAHLPGMLAAKTTVPVLGVPVPATALNGMDALLSIVQMPKGVPVATFAIGEAGAVNAALFAVAMLAANDEALGQRLADWREIRRLAVLEEALEDAPHTTAEPPKFNEDTQIALSAEPAHTPAAPVADARLAEIQDPL